jgi:hypothetical protein
MNISCYSAAIRNETASQPGLSTSDWMVDASRGLALFNHTDPWSQPALSVSGECGQVMGWRFRAGVAQVKFCKVARSMAGW